MPPLGQVPPTAPTGFRRWWPWLRRVATTALLAVAIGRLSGMAMRADARLTEPPGFTRGLLHGALMPIAWPSLLLGHDQPIYAEVNTGRLYKLGYSLGINVCGVGFFGWSFWRFNRWRAKRTG
jgi:hypothetical protein